jgi:phospholipid/cholesterol/gamma-HCH transport system ATP-binding protein
MSEARAHVILEDIDMAFGSRVVFRRLSCAIPRARVTCILGGSGSGKSTILKLIGGLVRPRGGHIRVDDEEITGLGERALFAVRRKLGMMFQAGALLDSLTVFDNLAFPLREHTKLPPAEIADAVHTRLLDVGLTDVDALLPGQLSGGMLKRVALARAMMMDPVILLCDEPFSGLDPLSVRRIEQLLLHTNRARGITTVVVSHDVASTLRMADYIVLLLDGQAVCGAPPDMIRSPDARVRAFFGEDATESVA